MKSRGQTVKEDIKKKKSRKMNTGSKDPKTGLNPSQEEFAFLVGYECMKLSEAYRQVYNTENSSVRTVCGNASNLNRKPEVKARVAHYHEMRVDDRRSAFKWDEVSSYDNLHEVIEQNMAIINDPSVPAISRAKASDSVISANKELNSLLAKRQHEENEYVKREANARIEGLELHNRLLKSKTQGNAEEVTIEVNL